MARPLRIEFPGAIYHVTSRGDRREPIFVGDADRTALLNVVGQAMLRFDAQMLAFCLMGNHYHFVLHTRQANLSMLMRHINGVYTQTFNRRHEKVGHLFQGRFKAILVDRDAYLLQLCRYVELNPVRAQLVKQPGAWMWSSYRLHTLGVTDATVAPWLDTSGLHGHMLGRPALSKADQRQAALRYARFVDEGREARIWDQGLRQQIFLGDEAFVEKMQLQLRPKPAKTQASAKDIPRVQRRSPRSLAQWLAGSAAREQAFYEAHTLGQYTMSAIAQEAGLSVSRVSRLVKRHEQQLELKLAKGKA